MSKKVIRNLVTEKFENVREELLNMFGGTVLDYEAKRIKDKAISEGRAEGRAEEIIEAGLESGLSESDIMVRIQNKLNISKQKAQEYFEMFGK